MPAPNSISSARALVLFAGDGEPMLDAIADVLRRKSIIVERCGREELVRAVTVSAPDLVFLTGDTVTDRGTAALEALAADPVASVAPVALFLDDASLDERLRAFRSGAVGIVPRTASAHAAAQRISELCTELPNRPGEAAGALGEASLDELAALIANKLRSGVVSVERENAPAMRLLLGSGGDVAAAVDQFVEQLKPLVSKAEPLRYELFEASGGRMQLWDDAAEGEGAAIYEELRIVVMDDDPGRADEFAVALRERGALVAITDVSTRGIERARSLDPAVIVLDESAIQGASFEIVRRIRRDPRLRWASLLVAKWAELWPKGLAAPDLEEIGRRLMPLVRQDRELSERCMGTDPFDTRLELTGPSRMLRAVSQTEGSRVVAARSTRTAVDVDLSGGLVVSAQGRVDGRDLAGLEALSALLTLGSARVRIERRTHPAAANIMLPVDEALAGVALADETVSAPPPPLLPSEPAPGPRNADSIPTRSVELEATSTQAPPPGYTPDAGRKPPTKARTQLGLGGFVPPASDPAVVSDAETMRPSPSRAAAMLGASSSYPPPKERDDLSFSSISDFGAADLKDGSEALDDALLTPDLADTIEPEVDDFGLDIDFGAAPSEAPGRDGPNEERRIEQAHAESPTITEAPLPLRQNLWIGLGFVLVAVGACAWFLSHPDTAPEPDTVSVLEGGADLDAPAIADANAGVNLGSENDTGTDAAFDAPIDIAANLRNATSPEPTEPEPSAESPDDSAEPEPVADIATLSDRERDRRSDDAARRAEAAAAAGNIALALRQAEVALRYAERNPQALAARATVAMAARNGDDAVNWAQRAARRRPRRASYQVLLGDAHRLAGNGDEATSAYRRALAIDPDHREAQARLR